MFGIRAAERDRRDFDVTQFERNLLAVYPEASLGG
jgi:hypothetical protein